MAAFATALNVASSLWRQIEDCDLRVIVTSSELNRLGLGRTFCPLRYYGHACWPQ